MAHSDRRLPIDDDAIVTCIQPERGESVLETVLRALAVAKNVPVVDLDPLYEQVDPEALAMLLEHARQRRTEIGVEFTAEEYGVVVSRDGSVCIHESKPILA